MARTRDRYEEDEAYDDEEDGGYAAPPPAASPWADTKVLVTIVIAVGILGIVGALVYRHTRTERVRRQRAADYRKLGVQLVREVHKIGVEYFSQQKQSLDPSRWEPFRSRDDVLDAILVELDDFEPHFVSAARFAEPKIAEYQGTIEELGGGVKMSKGMLTSGGVETPAWIFQLLIQDDKGRRLGKAMVCLKALSEE